MAVVSGGRRRKGAYYLAQDGQRAVIAPEQRFGLPRKGHGTVYVCESRDVNRQIVWTAEWIDEYEQPDADGCTVGIAKFEGDFEAAARWARTQPAASWLMASRSTPAWSPLPGIADLP
ncbi:hypothetical protein [Luedemannella flava]|uniref:hypothetical protein n=1 Tax=Luedemannella flava TaxID=349316 RepID=UPI0031E12830